MALTFADTHNMITYLTKSGASEGFNQIIDFLNKSAVKYALTVNLNIYVSCIKQFWSPISVKKVNDVTRLQALIDWKKVIITEATVREALRLDDAESIDCLPNGETFTELSRMGYEKPSAKLTFYKAFFSPQWNLVRNVDSSTKFYMYPRFLQRMIRAQVGDLSSHTTKYSSPALTQKVFANMRMVGKRFFRVKTPLFKGMIVARQADDIADEGATGVNVDDVPAADVKPSIPSPTPNTQPPPPLQELPLPHKKVEALKQDKVAQALEIIKLKQRVKKLERKHKLKVSGLKRLRNIIANIDADEDVTLKDVVAVEKNVEIEENTDDDDLEPAKLKEVVEVGTTAKLMTKVLTTVDATITAATTTITAATITTTPKEATDRTQARKNMMIYLRNMAGFKMDYIKGMSYDDIHPIFEKYFNSNVAFLEKTKEKLEEEESRALKRTSESLEEKAAKKQKLDEEVEKLVYTKATPLPLKVPVVYYAIHIENNKPYFKIIRADGTHQLFLSFQSLLRNFDREDLEVLWQLVKERFASSKPKNFLDDFLLTTLTCMFEKPNVEAQV
nr:hypothetical protein [Tanacetum cinerariifolium]